MKRLIAAASLALSFTIGGGAHAQSFLELKVDADDNTVVCVGDEEDASRYGGAPVIDGKATVLMPRPVLTSQKVSTVLITASNGEKAGSMKVNALKPTLEAALDLTGDKPGNCSPSRLIKAEKVPSMIAEFGKKHQSEILEYADGEIVTRGLFSEFLESNLRQSQGLMAQARGMEVMPSAHMAAIADAIAKIESKQREQERREMIERFAAAAEEYGRQQQERRDRLKAEKEAKEAEEARKKAEAERAEQAERERIEAMTSYCFGAVGEECGKFKATPYASWDRGLGIDFDIRKSTCVPSGRGHNCLVNSGSWLHDECCIRNPDGYVCGGADTSQVCKREWDRAWRRTTSLFSWVDYFGPQAHVGLDVDFQAHCAANGQLMEMPEDNPNDNDYGFDDRELCCSGNVRDLNWIEAGLVQTAHALLFYFEPTEICIK